MLDENTSKANGGYRRKEKSHKHWPLSTKPQKADVMPQEVDFKT